MLKKSFVSILGCVLAGAFASAPALADNVVGVGFGFGGPLPSPLIGFSCEAKCGFGGAGAGTSTLSESFALKAGPEVGCRNHYEVDAQSLVPTYATNSGGPVYYRLTFKVDGEVLNSVLVPAKPRAFNGGMNDDFKVECGTRLYPIPVIGGGSVPTGYPAPVEAGTCGPKLVPGAGIGYGGVVGIGYGSAVPAGAAGVNKAE